MLFSTIGQVYIFVWMIAAGLIIGAWYTLMAAVRRLLQAGFWLGLIADIGFGIGAAAIFCAFIVAANYGRVRLFAVLGVLIGCGLFAAGLWPPIRALCRSFAGCICRVCCKIKQNRLIKVIFR